MWKALFKVNMHMKSLHGKVANHVTSDTPINIITFYSEGIPNDNGLPLLQQLAVFKYLASKGGFNFEAFSPKLLRQIGAEDFVKAYGEDLALPKNAGLHKLGFARWKPLVILLALEKLAPNEVLIYQDVNIFKYPSYKSRFEHFRVMAGKAFEKFEHFIFPREFLTQDLLAYHYSHRYLMEEVANNTEFAKKYPLCNVSPIIVRPTDLTKQFLMEWLTLCCIDRFLLPLQDASYHPEFKHFTPEQSVLNALLIRWIQEGKLPKEYPGITFGRGYHCAETDNSHIKSLIMQKGVSKEMGSSLCNTFKDEFEDTKRAYTGILKRYNKRTTIKECENWREVKISLNQWRAADGGVLKSSGTNIILADSQRDTYQLIRSESELFCRCYIKAEIIARPTTTCGTGFHIQHWGGIDVCTIGLNDEISIRGNYLIDVSVEHLEDGYRLYRVVYTNFHYTLNIGMGKPMGRYIGSGLDQYEFKAINIFSAEM